MIWLMDLFFVPVFNNTYFNSFKLYLWNIHSYKFTFVAAILSNSQYSENLHLYHDHILPRYNTLHYTKLVIKMLLLKNIFNSIISKLFASRISLKIVKSWNHLIPERTEISNKVMYVLYLNNYFITHSL